MKIRVEIVTHYLETSARDIIEWKKAAIGPGCPLPTPVEAPAR